MRKKAVFSVLVTLVLFGILFVSCRKEESRIDKQTNSGVLKTNSDFDMPIYMGQNTLVGEAFINLVDESAIVVDVVLFDGIVPDEAHLYAGENPPPSSAPGSFPYHWYAGDEFPISFTIDISDWYECEGFEWFFALHLAIGTETAWILPTEGGLYWLNKKGKPTGWGQYFPYFFEECDPLYYD
jgi:hypothetical protein